MTPPWIELDRNSSVKFSCLNTGVFLFWPNFQNEERNSLCTHKCFFSLWKTCIFKTPENGKELKTIKHFLTSFHPRVHENLMLTFYVSYDLELTQGPGGLEISLVPLWHLGGCITSSEAGPAAINLRISSQNAGAEPDFRWGFFSVISFSLREMGH